MGNSWPQPWTGNADHLGWHSDSCSDISKHTWDSLVGTGYGSQYARYTNAPPEPTTAEKRKLEKCNRSTTTRPACMAWHHLCNIKITAGILSFTLAVTLPLTSLALLFEPLVYVLNVSINSSLGSHSVMFMPFFWSDSGQFEMIHFIQSFIGIPLGIVLGFASIYILKGLALASGELVRALLSPSDYNMSLPKDEYQYQYNGVPNQG